MTGPPHAIDPRDPGGGLQTTVSALENRVTALESELSTLHVDLGVELVHAATTDPTQVAQAACSASTRLISGGRKCSAGATIE